MKHDEKQPTKLKFTIEYSFRSVKPIYAESKGHGMCLHIEVMSAEKKSIENSKLDAVDDYIDTTAFM